LGLVLDRFLHRNEKRCFGGLILFIIIAIILTYSRSAYLMLFVFAFLLGVIRWKKILLVLLLGGVLLFLMSPRFSERIMGGITIDRSAVQRFSSWRRGLSIFQTSPVVGIGFNNFRAAQQKYNLFEPFSAEGGHSGAGVDSSLLLVLATTGVLGILLYLSFWFAVVKKMITHHSDFDIIIFCVLAGLLVDSQFINSLFYPSIMLWYFTVLGLMHDEK
jgi:O-antigen ligase